MMNPTFLITTFLYVAGAVSAQMQPRPKTSLDLAYTKERVHKLQVQASSLRHAAPRHARRAGTSPAPEPPCKYCGENPGPGQCKNNGGSDGCTDDCYSVSPTSLTLAGGAKLQDGGHINIQYIPYDQYKGIGGYRAQQPGWTVLSAGIHFESLNNQPSGAFVGLSTISWTSIIGTLPKSGFCIIWVQYSDCNQHFGEGQQGAVCFSASYTPGIGSGGSGSGSSSGSGTGTGNGSGSGAGSSSNNVNDPKVNAGQQCDGWGWDAAKPCRDGYACVGNTWSKQCQARTDFVCNRQYGQCGGLNYKGPTCCPESGWECKYSSQYYSQCVEKPYSP